ncbi:MAG: outer membrane protein assembly factor BamC [Pseudomonadales bacterium]|nr:outer membrane protein assembly factor BamC [Pseudomonadales bacterium]
MRNLAIVAAMLSGLSACSWFNDDKGFFVNRGDDYITTTENHDLVVPSDLNSAKVADPFPVPRIPNQVNAEFYPDQPPQPDAIYASDNRDEVRIQRLGERRWLAVPEAPTTVWPKVKQFLAENGVGIAAEVSSQGRIDTEWLEISDRQYRDIIRSILRDDRSDASISEGRDRLLIRVEPGLRELTSEIHLRYENDGLAPPRYGVIDLNEMQSLVPEVEVDMLNEIGAYIAARVSEQTISMVAQEIEGGIKSELGRDASGEPALNLRLDQERAWATIGQALSRAEVEVISLDEDTGIYEVSIPDKALTGEQRGWLAGLFGGGKKKYELQLHLARTSDTIFQVTVQDDKARPLDREFSQQVLSMLREFSS